MKSRLHHYFNRTEFFRTGHCRLWVLWRELVQQCLFEILLPKQIRGNQMGELQCIWYFHSLIRISSIAYFSLYGYILIERHYNSIQIIYKCRNIMIFINFVFARRAHLTLQRGHLFSLSTPLLGKLGSQYRSQSVPFGSTNCADPFALICSIRLLHTQTKCPSGINITFSLYNIPIS